MNDSFEDEFLISAFVPDVSRTRIQRGEQGKHLDQIEQAQRIRAFEVPSAYPDIQVPQDRGGFTQKERKTAVRLSNSQVNDSFVEGRHQCLIHRLKAFIVRTRSFGVQYADYTERLEFEKFSRFSVFFFHMKPKIRHGIMRPKKNAQGRTKSPPCAGSVRFLSRR